MTKKPSFEDCYAKIDAEIEKKRVKWTLHAISWMDFDDVKMIVLAHIHQKWSMWDHTRPLNPWVSSIAHNQITNIVRNNYTSFSRPCLACEFYDGNNDCSLYGEPCKTCPIYARWLKSKKSACDVKLTLPIENHQSEIYDLPCEHQDILPLIEEMHTKIKEKLSKFEYKVYNLLFIEGKDEEDVAKELNYKSNEKHRAPGYRSLYLVKKSILKKAKKLIDSGHFNN